MPNKGGLYPFNQPLFTSVINKAVTINFASIASGAQGVSQQTITGAKLGDHVIITADFDQQKVLLWGHVSAANTVEVVASNLTGGAVDLPSGTINIKVLGVK